MLEPALELNMPALALREPVLLGIGRPCRPEQPEAIAPQAETQGFLRSRQIELVDIERLEVPITIRLTAITAPVIEAHDRTLLPPRTESRATPSPSSAG